MRSTRLAVPKQIVHPARDVDSTIVFDTSKLALLQHWISERDAIRVLKESGAAKPWTNDPVLLANRFCNVRRMDDKVSQWLMREWYTPHAKANDRILLTAATLARHINWPDTLEYIRFPAVWNATTYAGRLHKWKAAGHKVFTGAYIINGGGRKGADKIDLVVERVQAVHDNAVAITHGNKRMRDVHSMLTRINGIGSFMAGQIVADLRYTRVLDEAYDSLEWAPRGPGSTRGMNRLLGRRPLWASFTDAAWQAHMQTLWNTLGSPSAQRSGRAWAVLQERKCELMDLQNCLCEFDKYVRVLTGEGRARNRYPGGDLF
jgi:hypothetical protein